GEMPQMVGECVIEKHQINPQEDLDLQQNIDLGNIAGALASGDSEYVRVCERTESLFEKEGKGYVIASFGEESGHVPYTVFTTKQSYLRENEEHVRKFTKAIYRAQQWVDEQSAEEVANVIAPYFEDVEHDILTA